MTPISAEARALLAKAARQDVLIYPRDPKWPLVTQLQRAGLARLEWKAGRIAKVVVLEAGLAVVRENGGA